MRAALIFALSVGAVSPVNALSCMRPDVAQSFQQADASDDVYSVVLGKLRFDPLVPPLDGTDATSASIPARFTGRSLGPDGFATDVSVTVTIEVSCIPGSPWCGNINAPGTQVLAFLRHGPSGLVLDVEPCPQWVFAKPSSKQIEAVSECLTGGICAVRD